ncbi:tetraacyldisaccharide 4'-kinase [Fibrobacter sp. UWB12]|uniref:tetraacyldisaccharide 4'-kinase n=1 Tax=Fibrobacter sp. UWB12 TaxID=1896203 RepID=UPI0009155EF9|nr:tetraacyldisaccharide 4'-kinase [Fibrobacter sp. UWB12]SHL02002.1 lipid-A-disaccharide kinase [Fibrobacter sp. UWB12]
MKHITKSFRLVASAFYRIAYKLHHKLFLRPQPQLRVPVFIVGSYLAGGAGKTPFTIWLAKHFQEQGKKIAILCHSAAWDEFIMIEREFQSAKSTQIKVFATKNRYKTAKEIQDKFDIILCDDGFEDSRFTGAHRICLDWQEPPQSIASLLPSGPFRSLKQDHDETEIIHLDCVGNNGHCVNSPAINFSIESITNFAAGKPLTATAICGLGNPKRFVEDIRTFGINVEKAIVRRDHDKHFQQTVQAELAQDKDIVISQKDACRLQQSLLAHPKLHTAIQKITVSDNILKKLL